MWPQQKAISLLVIIMLGLPSFANTNESNALEYDFGQDKSGYNWRVINDGVMGGLSRGQAKLTENSLFYTGDISLENNGGFSSLKAPFVRTDLSAFKTVVLRYRHSGHQLGLTFEWHPRFWRTYHKQILETTKGEWQTVRFDLNKIPQFRLTGPTGRVMQEKDLKRIIRIGFIASEKKSTSFEFEIDYLRFE